MHGYIQTGQFINRHLSRLLLSELKFKTFEALFQLHQSVRQGVDGLGDILGRAGDAKGHGLSHG